MAYKHQFITDALAEYGFQAIDKQRINDDGKIHRLEEVGISAPFQRLVCVRNIRVRWTYQFSMQFRLTSLHFFWRWYIEDKTGKYADVLNEELKKLEKYKIHCDYAFQLNKNFSRSLVTYTPEYVASGAFFMEVFQPYFYKYLLPVRTHRDYLDLLMIDEGPFEWEGQSLIFMALQFAVLLQKYPIPSYIEIAREKLESKLEVFKRGQLSARKLEPGFFDCLLEEFSQAPLLDSLAD